MSLYTVHHINDLPNDVWEILVPYLLWIDIVHLVISGNSQIALKLRHARAELNFVDNAITPTIVKVFSAKKITIDGCRLLTLLPDTRFCSRVKSVNVCKSGSFRVDAIDFGRRFPQLVELTLSSVHQNMNMIHSLPQHLLKLCLRRVKQFFSPFVLKLLPPTLIDLCLWNNLNSKRDEKEYQHFSSPVDIEVDEPELHFPPPSDQLANRFIMASLVDVAHSHLSHLPRVKRNQATDIASTKRDSFASFASIRYNNE